MADNKKHDLTTTIESQVAQAQAPSNYRRVVVELEGGRRIVCHLPPDFDAMDALAVERWLIAEVRKTQHGAS